MVGVTDCPICELVDGPGHAISVVADEIKTTPESEQVNFVAAKRALEDEFDAGLSVLTIKKHLIRMASRVLVTDDGGTGR